jgi:Flp pilus assembly protein TadG
MKQFLKQFAALLRGRDRGTVAITFLLSLPLLLFILCILTQYALMINARLVVAHAAANAARTAMTALPTDPAVDTTGNSSDLDGVEFVNTTARMQLEAISPVAKITPSEEAASITNALQIAGADIPDSYKDRYTFAENATTISWQRLDSNGTPIVEEQWEPAQFAAASGQRIRLTVQYNFLLNVPAVSFFIGHADTIAGVTGRFATFTSTFDVQLAHGRETATNANGWPIAQ